MNLLLNNVRRINLPGLFIFIFASCKQERAISHLSYNTQQL